VEHLQWNLTVLKGDLSREYFGMFVPPAGASRIWLAACFMELGEFAAALTCTEEGLRIGEAVQQPFSLAFGWGHVGRIHLAKGEVDEAISVLERALQICEGVRIPLAFAWVAPALGLAYALAGRLAEALQILRQAVEQSSSLGFRTLTSGTLIWQGEAYLLADNLTDAREIGTQALERTRARSERGIEASALRLLAEIAAKADPPDPEQAETSYRQALALATELGMRPLAAHGHLGLGSLLRRVDRSDEAQVELETAAELYRAMEMTFWLARAEAELAGSGTA
jgi:tetratricopeptide (TPR) repeat protein